MPDHIRVLPATAMGLTGSVPGAYVRLLFDYLARQGADAAVILGEAPPPPEATPSSYPALRWAGMLAAAARQLHDPALGLHVGASITPAHLGPLGYVLLASQSVLAALQRYLRYQRLVHDVSPVRTYAAEDRLILEWSDESRHIGLLANQCGLAALVQFARDITDSDVDPVAIHFVEPAPADVAPYAELFRCPVLFGQKATRVCFPASLLELPLRRADPALVAMLERQVEASLAAMPGPDHLLQTVRRCISSHLLDGESMLDQVAQELHVSGRTLRRWLHARGWSFRNLLEDTRRRLAEHYLRDTQLSLPEVALLLGYSEQSAFNRAFLNWSGETPRRWRLAARQAV
ncbi:AraC family transcriptional regulator [Rugamonas apoptosis]|uniref:AraC family transcriptional regulator n=1 Tax=Rugamonas apoptosis TaxID=2758570 RepID=A0A7W2F9L0_9BURK|nr:AraC family transcriptional regulator [Rugamonas apoptosis]MBA5687653.1 AraC family transcriptional regulator [Rugamonas apoptosis]